MKRILLILLISLFAMTAYSQSIIIADETTTTFTYNGVSYPKIYKPEYWGGKVQLRSVYEQRALMRYADVAEWEVDGNTFANDTLLGAALLQVTFGSTIAYVNDTLQYYFLSSGDSTLESSLYIQEQAAADADKTGVGQVWVKSDAPNTLWFTDDAGTDTQLGAGGGGAITVYKTADEGRTTTTTLADDADMVIALEANSTYSVVLWIAQSSSIAGDFKWEVSIPAGSTGGYIITHHDVDGLELWDVPRNSVGTNNSTGQFLSGYIYTAGTAGDFQFRWAQQTASGTSTLQKGSYIIMHKLG